MFSKEIQLYSNRMKIWHGLILVMVLVITPMSCDNALNQSLELAGENRQEMEKVLETHNTEGLSIEEIIRKALALLGN